MLKLSVSYNIFSLGQNDVVGLKKYLSRLTVVYHTCQLSEIFFGETAGKLTFLTTFLTTKGAETII